MTLRYKNTPMNHCCGIALTAGSLGAGGYTHSYIYIYIYMYGPISLVDKGECLPAFGIPRCEKGDSTRNPLDERKKARSRISSTVAILFCLHVSKLASAPVSTSARPQVSQLATSQASKQLGMFASVVFFVVLVFCSFVNKVWFCM